MDISTKALLGLDVLVKGDVEKTSKEQGESISMKQFTLYKYLNECKTKMGARKLLERLQKPMMNKEDIKYWHTLVEEGVNNYPVVNEIRENVLQYIPDIDPVCNRIERSKGKLKDLMKLGKFANAMPHMIKILLDMGSETLQQSFINPLQTLEKAFHQYLRFINDALVYDEDIHEVFINPNVSEGLAACFSALEQAGKQLSASSDRINANRKMNGKQVGLRYGNLGKYQGHYLESHSEYETTIQEIDPSYQLLQAKGKKIRFLINEIKTLEQAYQDAKSAYEAESKKYESDAIELAASYLMQFQKGKELIMDVDLAMNFAYISERDGFSRPTMLEASAQTIELQDAVHPLLLNNQMDQQPIFNNVQINPNRHFIIITGPNMGGKSTYLKLIGITVLMAQIGMFIPAKSGKISIRSSLNVRIGAADSLLENRSTFLNEMMEMKHIFEKASPYALCLIDELGRGTNAIEGEAIARSMSTELMDIQKYGMVLFATHFHRLTDLHEQYPNDVHNLKVGIQETPQGMILTYKVEDGASAKSFGFHVAQTSAFPLKVIDRAQEILRERKKNRPEWSDPRPIKKVRKEHPLKQLFRSFTNLDFSTDYEHIKQQIVAWQQENQ